MSAHSIFMNSTQTSTRVRAIRRLVDLSEFVDALSKDHKANCSLWVVTVRDEWEVGCRWARNERQPFEQNEPDRDNTIA